MFYEHRSVESTVRQYDKMIQQQEQPNKEAAAHSQLLQSINQNIQNLANRPQPAISVNGGSLFDTVSQSTQKEGDHHGSVPSRPLIFK